MDRLEVAAVMSGGGFLGVCIHYALRSIWASVAVCVYLAVGMWWALR